MRLGGVTQVVGAAEGQLFHNRLTHTLEVAQLARRFAERFAVVYKTDLAKAGLHLDPDVAEAAALAHDLGHPPFGHVAEDALKTLVLAASKKSGERPPSPAKEYDGYEGNAQSFRIVARLAARRPGEIGLDLTQATLNGMLKYPVLRDDADAKNPDKIKYGAYRTEGDDFAFARTGTPDQIRSPEAEMMNHADNIAYSVHDLIDFYRAGLVPLELIAIDTFGTEIQDYIDYTRVEVGETAAVQIENHRTELEIWVKARFPRARHNEQVLGATRGLTTALIDDFVTDTGLEFSPTDFYPRVKIPALRDVEMKFLQRLVWKYVINSDRLATQQHGQREVIVTLFNTYFDAIINDPRKEAPRILPGSFASEPLPLSSTPLHPGELNHHARVARIAADAVASFTDAQAVKVYQRLLGVASGSVTDLMRG